MENVIHHVISQIVARCPGVHETLAAFVVKAVLLEEAHQFDLEHELRTPDITKLVDMATERLQSKDSAGMHTMRLQVEFDQVYVHQTKRLEDLIASRNKKSDIVLRSVLDARPRGKVAYEAVYRNIVSFILVRHNQGSASNVSVIKEVTADLESVFPETDLATFLALSQREKETQLIELADIVLGIRLFNRQTGAGGAGIEDVPSAAADATDRLLQSLESWKERIGDQVAWYSALINSLHFDQAADTPANRERVQQLNIELTNRRQMQTYLDIVLEDVRGSQERQAQLAADFQVNMEAVQSAVRARTAVPTSEIYPRFVTLAQLWTSLLEERMLLATRDDVTKHLISLNNSFASSLSEADIERARSLVDSKAGAASGTDSGDAADDEGAGNSSARNAEHRADGDDDDNEKWTAELVPSASIENLDELTFQFKGFCPVTIVARGGLLLPGDSSLGVLVYQDQYYRVANPRARAAFMDDPERYVAGVLVAAQQRPELINLLGVNAHFPSITRFDLGGRRSTLGDSHPLLQPKAKTADASIGTDTHPIEAFIDPKYHWNEWTLRREALMLADLRRKATHGSQTNVSHFRRDSETQHYASRGKGTQTGHNSATSVPKQSKYVTGLRGAPGTSMHVVDLTLDLDAGWSSVRQPTHPKGRKHRMAQ